MLCYNNIQNMAETFMTVIIFVSATDLMTLAGI